MHSSFGLFSASIATPKDVNDVSDMSIDLKFGTSSDNANACDDPLSI
jgi:hypothetical protein